MTKPQIILVDDEAFFLKPSVEELTRAFPDCSIVSLTSEKAFQKHISSARDSDIAVVIADAVLGPLERGTDILLFCRQRLPHARRVLMSNKASREDLEDAINRCALDGYIEKHHPLRPQEIALLTRLLASVRTAGPANDLAASKMCDDLEHITAGSRKQANLYKNAVRDLLAYVFYPWLAAPQTEVPIRNATKAVDILLQNAATEGILADLKRRYDSLLVPVETKNSKMLRSSYFSQLEGYLTGPVGKWGILCFRGKIEKKHQAHVRAAHNEGKLIMLFTDSELVALVKAKISGRQTRDDYNATLDQFLRKKYAESIG
jgi:DNA-binding NarL/FixJ family response regulator